MRLVAEGKSKLVYEKDGELVLEFKDEVTAMDGAVRATAPGKGVLNARISAYLFSQLEKRGIETHFIEYDGGRRLRVRKLRMIPLEVIVRNYAYGSLLRRMPLIERLAPLSPPIVEFHLKNDELHDPLVLREDILAAKLLTPQQLDEVVSIAIRVDDVLTEVFRSRGLKLIDMKLEMGFDPSGRILVADEISGDTIRVMDERGRHLDKEVFRRSGDPKLLIEAYTELARRLGLEVSDVARGRGGDN
ncbi:MAG: phosphoribosylaminoimidazolesuccinocarboxamide synthase [Crenarchaeota archaeon]|nr:phosphoribosylaminoimidazolesuccinocarboxamide synthase [Thermoproteota archaeon]